MFNKNVAGKQFAKEIDHFTLAIQYRTEQLHGKLRHANIYVQNLRVLTRFFFRKGWCSRCLDLNKKTEVKLKENRG